MNQAQYRVRRGPVAIIEMVAVRVQAQLRRSKTKHSTGEQFWA